ncbi:methyltransferase [Burkholderia sp. F1]|uniref:methyltransferase n=1 Tax=Burkholderia sp. F1 TaxID=3366817 RepID=UPI003D70332E
MFIRFPSAPRKVTPLPLFCFSTLHMSEKVRWLGNKGLIDPIEFLRRHMRGDWGDVDSETRLSNDASLAIDGPLTSRYVVNRQLHLLIETSEEGITNIFLDGETAKA